MKYKHLIQASRYDEDEDEDNFPFQGNNKHLSFFTRQQVQSRKAINFILDEEIKAPDYYRPLLETIYTADEADTVILRIDSYGGHVDGALAIVDALENTDAQVHCYVSGMCASAATIIALSCPSLSVSPRSRWMIHQGSFGSGGKVGDVMNHTLFVDQHLKSIMAECYGGFLSTQELNEVFMGRDIYMQYDEVMQRLEKRRKYLDKLERQAKKQDKVRSKSIQNISNQETLDTES